MILVEHRVSGIPVCDIERHVLGVVSEGDILYKAQAREERGGPLARFLREIRMRGTGVTLREMQMIETNGDETRTEFQDVNTRRRFRTSRPRRA